MKKILGLAILAAATLGTVTAGRAADMGGTSKLQGKWSTWGCNVAWFDLGPNKITYYSTEEKLPGNVVSSHDATIAENGGKLDVDYKFLGSDYKYIYGVKGNDALQLDRLLIDNNVEFDRTKSGSPYKDRETQRCSPAA